MKAQFPSQELGTRPSVKLVCEVVSVLALSFLSSQIPVVQWWRGTLIALPHPNPVILYSPAILYLLHCVLFAKRLGAL